MFKRSILSTSIAAAIALGSQPLLAQTQDSDMDLLEEIVVTGIRGSLTRALDVKRQSYQIVDAIVAEDIGKFPDNNVVEALQRVSGVQVTDRGAGEVSAVAIRGLPDVTTTINGRTIFTGAGRSVALQDVPASLLGQVDVYKTRSASHIETGIAGQIDIHTQRPFNFDGSRVVLAGRAIYHEQADEVSPNVSALFSDRWDTGFGELGALLNVSYAKTNYRDQSVTSGAMFPFATDNPPTGWAPYEIIQAFDDNRAQGSIWRPGSVEGLPFAAGSTLDINGVDVPYLLARDAIFANDFTGERERPAANLSLQFAPNDTSEYLFEAFYNGYRNESFNSLLFSTLANHTDLGPNPSDGITVYEGTNVVKSRDQMGSVDMFTSGDLATGKTDSYVVALGGNWDITNDFFLKSEIVHQTSEFNDEFIAMRLNRQAHQVWVDFNSGNGFPAFGFRDNVNTPRDESDLNDPDQWTFGQLYDNAFRTKGDAITFTIDGDYDLDFGPIQNVKFGLRYDDRGAADSSRTQDAGVCTATPQCTLSAFPGLQSINSGFFDGRSDVPTTWSAADGHYLQTNADQIRELYNQQANADLLLSDALSLRDTFEITEVNTAIYLQADFETEVAGRILDGQFGVRYVHVDTDMTFYDYPELEPVNISRNSKSISRALPSLMVRYNITDDLMARFSYGETLRLPEFGALNPHITYAANLTGGVNGNASSGNPNLEPTESKNIDFSLEWYFAPSSSLYGTVFRRDIEGLVIDFRRPITYEGEPYIYSQPNNASNGKLDGIELGLVYFPDNLPEMLDGLGVQASYTLLDSVQDVPEIDENGVVTGSVNTPFFAVSDASYSVVVAYDKNDLELRLSYVWRDDFLNNNEAAQFANPIGIYRKPETSVDFQASYTFTDNFVATFDVTNLTNEAYQSYYEYPTTHNFGTSLFSRTFAVGARYSF